MSVREVPGYEVVCDEPDCSMRTSELGGEFAFWANKFAAEDDWTDHDGQATPDGKHYCDEHRKPACADCGRMTDLVNDDPDDGDDGDWWCPLHRETAPEYAPATGIVT